ncbi:MAG: hypothetical protein V1811_00425 [Candidatus Micrarchaeota archaeon]
MTEQTGKPASGDKMVYAGFAILGLLFIAFAAYSMLQINALNSRVNSLADYSTISNKLASIESRLAVLETNTPLAETTVTLFYDSTCTFCRNDELLSSLSQLSAQVAKNRVKLVAFDINGNYSPALNAGLPRFPAFFVSDADAEKNPNSATLVQTFGQFGFAVVKTPFGIAALSVRSVLLSGESCAPSASSAKLQEFFSESCESCKRLKTSTGVIINPTNPPVTAEEGLALVLPKFGNKLVFEPLCININEGDAAICSTKYGANNYSIASNLSVKYSVWNANPPTFVLDCKYVIQKALTEEQITLGICDARPDLCKGIPMTTANATK